MKVSIQMHTSLTKMSLKDNCERRTEKMTEVLKQPFFYISNSCEYHTYKYTQEIKHILGIIHKPIQKYDLKTILNFTFKRSTKCSKE